MSFEFYCPQGHLLKSDVAHAGQQCQCPHCGMQFIIPRPHLPEAEQAEYLEPVGPVGDYLSTLGDSAPAGDWQAAGQHAAPFSPAVDEASAGYDDPTADFDEPDAASTDLHIPCPNGHVLDSPLDMIGQEVLCPTCGVQFLLRREDSLEEVAEQERRDRKAGERWLIWSIVAAVGVVILLGAIMFARNR